MLLSFLSGPPGPQQTVPQLHLFFCLNETGWENKQSLMVPVANQRVSFLLPATSQRTFFTFHGSTSCRGETMETSSMDEVRLRGNDLSDIGETVYIRLLGRSMENS